MTKKPQPKPAKTSSQAAKRADEDNSRNVRKAEKEEQPTPETTVRHNPEHVDDKPDEVPVPTATEVPEPEPAPEPAPEPTPPAPPSNETGPSVSSRI